MGRTGGRGSSRGRGTLNERELKSELDSLFAKLSKARRPWSLRRARHEFERAYVDFIIRRYEGDRRRAADRLDIGFSTLKEKIRKG